MACKVPSLVRHAGKGDLQAALSLDMAHDGHELDLENKNCQVWGSRLLGDGVTHVKIKVEELLKGGEDSLISLQYGTCNWIQFVGHVDHLACQTARGSECRG